jgi:hypothetical protein
MAHFGSPSESPPFLAVVGDVEGSRELADRAGFQRRLTSVLSLVNGILGPNRLAAEVRITAGDEVQGLLSDPAALVEVAVAVADHLHPVRVVLGAGWGPLTTDPGPDVALLDGPCFHRARRSLEEARRRGTWVRVEGLAPLEDGTLSALFGLMGAIRSRWTEKQAGYAREAREGLQKDVAERAGVSPSVVSESLKAARFDAVLEGAEAARRILERFGSTAELGIDSGPNPNPSRRAGG